MVILTDPVWHSKNLSMARASAEVKAKFWTSCLRDVLPRHFRICSRIALVLEAFIRDFLDGFGSEARLLTVAFCLGWEGDLLLGFAFCST